MLLYLLKPNRQQAVYGTKWYDTTFNIPWLPYAIVFNNVRNKIEIERLSKRIVFREHINGKSTPLKHMEQMPTSIKEFIYPTLKAGSSINNSPLCKAELPRILHKLQKKNEPRPSTQIQKIQLKSSCNSRFSSSEFKSLNSLRKTKFNNYCLKSHTYTNKWTTRNKERGKE